MFPYLFARDPFACSLVIRQVRPGVDFEYGQVVQRQYGEAANLGAIPDTMRSLLKPAGAR